MRRWSPLRRRGRRGRMPPDRRWPRDRRAGVSGGRRRGSDAAALGVDRRCGAVGRHVGLRGCLGVGLGVGVGRGGGSLGGQHLLAHDGGDAFARDDSGTHDAQQPHAIADAGGVDDGRGRVAGSLADRLVGVARGAAVEVHGDVLAEHLLGVGGGGRRRHARQVRRRHGERAGLGKQFERDRVGRHAQRHGAARLAEVPLQRGLRVQDHGEPAGPELGHELTDDLGDVGRERVEGGDAGDEHGRRRGALAALGVRAGPPPPGR